MPGCQTLLGQGTLGPPDGICRDRRRLPPRAATAAREGFCVPGAARGPKRVQSSRKHGPRGAIAAARSAYRTKRRVNFETSTAQYVLTLRRSRVRRTARGRV
jgi:heterodisulfide reductase subunit A-like polyferredoxin